MDYLEGWLCVINGWVYDGIIVSKMQLLNDYLILFWYNLVLLVGFIMGL